MKKQKLKLKIQNLIMVLIIILLFLSATSVYSAELEPCLRVGVEGCGGGSVDCQCGSNTCIAGKVCCSYNSWCYPGIDICLEECEAPRPPAGWCRGPLVPSCPVGGCKIDKVIELIYNVINFILQCLTPIFAGLLIMIGGFYLLTAAGDPNRIETGKKVLTAAIIGLMIVFLARGLLTLFLKLIGAKITPP